ncbi:dTDP-4-dehydrorhamnose reductase [Vibrio parahaemolyticus]|nr:dTDP-4-dehydrorhamnose reductase [Vibrio parahaemolyticus]EGU0146202.1 dTDP-4-dehydrorhamnose reductase [Vibrio parahaemolyticus]MBE3899544.1 dTDP-4-dehydrorhamnose reductase [Vibrio parahaemolyticus]MCR9654618.1 dTDP-4-dehydrorhamnose reductase [Vibrio parahaemolyticus]
MKVLITGAKGQVGSCLVQRLNRRPDVDVIAYDRDELDITCSASVAEAVAKLCPDVIINAAAYTAVDKAEEEVELSYLLNRDGPKHLALAAEANSCTLLHISTDYVFDGSKPFPYVESDLTNPQTVYGKSKLEGEKAVAENCSKHIILRTAWVFGESGNNFVKTMLKLAKSRSELSVIGDQFGGPTYAGDIASALISIVDQLNTGKDTSGIYHFAGEPHVSWYEFACEIFAKAKEGELLDTLPMVRKITTEDYPTLAERPKNSRLDCSKIRSVFGITTSSWATALDNIRDYAHENN